MIPPIFRALVLLLMLVSLAGCKKPSSTDTGPAQPSDTSAGTSKPSAATDAEKERFIGTWSIQHDNTVADRTNSGDDGRFDIVIFPNGTAVTNWSQGEAGAQGELGKWKLEKSRIVLSYDSGWDDVIIFDGSKFQKFGYAPGTPTSDPPSNRGTATRVEGEILPFVGVWQAQSALDQQIFYIALESDGHAFKTITPEAPGTWKVVDGTAVIEWTDGWHDIIRPVDKGYILDGWEPGHSRTEKPHNSTEVFMFGSR